MEANEREDKVWSVAAGREMRMWRRWWSEVEEVNAVMKR